MKIFITGGTGFVGTAMVNKLLEKGHSLKLLSKSQVIAEPKKEEKKEIFIGDVTDPKSFYGKMDGCDAVIHLVGIFRDFPSQGITFEKLHFEATKNIVEETKKAGIKRYLHMSAIGVSADSKSEYKQTKYKAEIYVKNSGLTYTIFKPSVIVGKNDKSINMFADMIRNSPVFPIIGDGKYRFQPVALENVIDGFVNSLEMPISYNKAYNIGGPIQYTYNELIDTIAAVMNKKPVKMHIPKEIFYLSAHLLDWNPKFPITTDQIHMLFEESISNDNLFFDELKIKPISFKEKIAEYIK